MSCWIVYRNVKSLLQWHLLVTYFFKEYFYFGFFSHTWLIPSMFSATACFQAMHLLIYHQPIPLQQPSNFWSSATTLIFFLHSHLTLSPPHRPVWPLLLLLRWKIFDTPILKSTITVCIGWEGWGGRLRRWRSRCTGNHWWGTVCTKSICWYYHL